MSKDQGDLHSKIKNTKNTKLDKMMKIYQKEIEKGVNLMIMVTIKR